MEEREPLRLTFELPAQALDQAARLLEAVRLLLEAGQTRDLPARQPLERGESAGFDEDRFRALAAGRGEDVSSAPRSPAAETSAAAGAAAPSPIVPPGETAPAAAAAGRFRPPEGFLRIIYGRERFPPPPVLPEYSILF